MGTFITEFEDGKAICAELFRSKQSAIAFADRMIEICRFLGFDGYLVNIENEVDELQMPVLLAFLEHLRDALPAIIW